MPRLRWLRIGVLGSALITATPVWANVTYSFVTLSAQGTTNNYGGFPNDGTGFAGFPLAITFTNAGVASGEVSGSESAQFNAPPELIGLAGFVGLTTAGDSATPAALYDSLSLDVVFTAGAITSETIDFSGTDLDFSIVNGAASLGSDGLLNCTAVIESGACTSTGRFVATTAVPEPDSLPVVLAGLFGLLALRRTR